VGSHCLIRQFIHPALTVNPLPVLGQPLTPGATIGLLKRMIRAVSFDVGGTLIRPWPSVGHVYAEVAAESGFPALDPDDLTHRFSEAWSLLKPSRYSREEWAAIVDATFAGLIPDGASRALFPTLYDRFNDVRCWEIFDDVLPTLLSLKLAGLKLVILSNWDERLRRLLAKLELLPAFDEVVVSCEIGAAKPTRAIFETAEARLKLSPRELLHIGDSQREDLAGALACGWNALLIDRSRAAAPDRVASLGQLVDHRLLRRSVATPTSPGPQRCSPPTP
jgi:putative hydrolase of the HAD superfamily